MAATAVNADVSEELGRRRFRLLTDVEIESLAPPEWLVEGVLPAGRLALLYGAPGDGKTFIALHLALCVATGKPFFGRPVTPGSAVYVAAEGQSGLTIRVPAWKRYNNCPELPRAFFLTEPVQLLEEDHLTMFSSVLRGAHRPSLIVIDTLSRCLLGGEEDSARDMGRLVQAADDVVREFDTAVLLIHHPTKDKKTERGSGALRGAVDTVLRVSRKAGLISLTCEKQKEADPHDPIGVKLLPVALGDGRESCVAVLASGERTGGDESVAALSRKLLRALVSVPGAEATSAAWKDVAADLKIPARTFYRYTDELVRAGLVDKTGTGRAVNYAVTAAGHCHCQVTAN